MAKSGNIKNNSEFAPGEIVRLNNGGDPLSICPAPPKNEAAPDGFTWAVMWIADPAQPHPQYFLLPTSCLVRVPSIKGE